MEHNQCRSLSYFLGKGRVSSPQNHSLASMSLRQSARLYSLPRPKNSSQNDLGGDTLHRSEWSEPGG